MQVAFCTFRLGGHDGVAVEVAKWQRAFALLGWSVRSIAGEGSADQIVSGLGLEAVTPPDVAELEAALTKADVVVVDNVCSIPLNAAAAEALSSILRGRPAVLRHHDLVWQHQRWERAGWTLPDDPNWQHVVISERSRKEMADRGLTATTIYNTFEVTPPGDRQDMRARLDVAEHERLFLHPSRAIARKNIPEALALSAAMEATYWLTGDAEQGYGDELARLLDAAPLRVIRQPADLMADAYAACDAVVFPSTWEGFGNPPVEAAVHRRPAAVGSYPVASELVERFGFRWFPSSDPEPLSRWLATPDRSLLDHNRQIVVDHFSPDSLTRDLSDLLARWGW